MFENWFDRIFKDRNGNVVIGQPPNLPIMIWAIASALKLIFTSGIIYTGLDAIGLIAIVIWSLVELFQGVNYFRRGLGLVVLIGTIASRF